MSETEPLNAQSRVLVIDAENADWPKMTFDFYSTNAADFREELAGLGWTVEDFKTLPSYRHALASGQYPWLADL